MAAIQRLNEHFTYLTDPVSKKKKENWREKSDKVHGLKNYTAVLEELVCSYMNLEHVFTGPGRVTIFHFEVDGTCQTEDMTIRAMIELFSLTSPFEEYVGGATVSFFRAIFFMTAGHYSAKYQFVRGVGTMQQERIGKHRAGNDFRSDRCDPPFNPSRLVEHICRIAVDFGPSGRDRRGPRIFFRNGENVH